MSRVAVVTGGASGIGLGVARQFAADGHQVAIIDRNMPRRPRQGPESYARTAAPPSPSR